MIEIQIHVKGSIVESISIKPSELSFTASHHDGRSCSLPAIGESFTTINFETGRALVLFGERFSEFAKKFKSSM
jgi:hypothetical protein